MGLPEHTEPLKKVVRLQDMDRFPVIFKLCIKPGGFDQARLKEEGYQDAKSYFFGESRYNNQSYGWAGHNKDGSTRAGVKGRVEKYFKKKIVHASRHQNSLCQQY